jgi:phosphatidylserine/phosphatidylglycerophosphate/cardiolipin synthase-like enzyme
VSRFPTLVLVASLVLGTALAGGTPASATERNASAATQELKQVARQQAPKPPKKWRKWEAPSGPFFNDPHRKEGHFRIERRIVDTIKHTPRGSYIRIAVYSFDRVNVADALIAAYRRGVKVQILLNDHQDTKAMKILRKRLGTDTRKKNFIFKCRSGCRTDRPKRLLHTKFYLFSKTGKSKYAVFFGSHNLTMNAARHQWNDLYLTAGDKPLFKGYVNLFQDMASDYRKQQEPLPTFCGVPRNGVTCDDAVDFGTTVVFPRLVGPVNDPIAQILNRVQCITKTADGRRVRTKLAVNMHTIRGRRGDYLADAFRRKFAEGCAARFSFGLVGYHTKGRLGAKTPRGRLPLRSTAFDYNPDQEAKNPDGKLDLTLDYYSHQKYLVIRGNYAGNPNANVVFTGSSNWAANGAVNDDIVVGMPGRRVARQYMANFNFMWRPGNSRNAYTTTYLNFRGKPQKRVEVDPALVYRPAGPFWEDD